MKTRLIFQIFRLFVFILFFITACERKTEVTLFPIENYNQNTSEWIDPSSETYETSLLSPTEQKLHYKNFLDRNFGELSAWNEKFVDKVLGNSLTPHFKKILDFFEAQKGFGENLRTYPTDWLERIQNNMNLAQFDSLKYDNTHRAIAVQNLNMRTLPTTDVYFLNLKNRFYIGDGEGYPFDDLQMTAVWIGSPIYIIGYTKDRSWAFVFSSQTVTMGWVRSNNIAKTTQKFIDKWTLNAHKTLIAITKTRTNLIDTHGNYLESAFVGSVFPGRQKNSKIQILVPIKTPSYYADIETVNLPLSMASIMPISPTSKNFSQLINTLKNRPYGWGNLYFFNDCSSEMKSLFTPFGVWLPRHSSAQVKVGSSTDLTKYSAQERIDYLLNKGKPLTTIVYVGGHIIQYVGKFKTTLTQSGTMAMTYQNFWGLHLFRSADNSRAIVGKSVFFPLLAKYPEDQALISQANKEIFIISDLSLYSNEFKKKKYHDPKFLMYPDAYRFTLGGDVW